MIEYVLLYRTNFENLLVGVPFPIWVKVFCEVTVDCIVSKGIVDDFFVNVLVIWTWLCLPSLVDWSFVVTVVLRAVVKCGLDVVLRGPVVTSVMNVVEVFRDVPRDTAGVCMDEVNMVVLWELTIDVNNINKTYQLCNTCIINNANVIIDNIDILVLSLYIQTLF